ncbi:unnamed protein product [Ostreobium quekettii]|uniref:Uncharacterized protein n=1 Tax=Ostreobium quekettii TaxID=121088 RepID=A0A8S1ISG0_9CHLO|nr:unnamed protein product [Ostreobium quekettii]|eukprot:evm.model.scf_357.1 EVM.evm.TU.scf_357.1   scf_357:4408-10263(+)
MSSDPATSSAPEEQAEARPIKPKSTLDSNAEFPKSITLQDGTQIPVGLPPGIDPAQGKQVLDFLKANPEYAQHTMKQLNKILQNPAMAQQIFRMQAMTSTPEYQEQMAVLKEDPELKGVFDEIKKGGPEAIDKYWNDMELMSKISKKMAALNIGAENDQKQEDIKVDSLHAAAKAGDTEAVKKFTAEGADVNKKDARGITPLGVAIGFNRTDVVKELLANGADVSLRDNHGNTVLHYAAGYGRVECADMLLKGGADPKTMNNNNQTPLDVAELNREKKMVEFLKKVIPAEDKYV